MLQLYNKGKTVELSMKRENVGKGVLQDQTGLFFFLIFSPVLRTDRVARVTTKNGKLSNLISISKSYQLIRLVVI